MEYLSKAHEMGGSFRVAGQSAAIYDSFGLSFIIYPALTDWALCRHPLRGLKTSPSMKPETI